MYKPCSITHASPSLASGTTTFNLAIDEIVEEGYERCGIRTNSGYDLKSGRRTLNILLQDWNNRGINLWKIKLIAQELTAGTSKYSAEAGSSDIMEAYVSNNATLTNNTTSSSDVSLTKIDRSTYQAFSNKTATGQPTQYWVQRFIDKVNITLYLTPGSSEAGKFINYY